MVQVRSKRKSDRKILLSVWTVSLFWISSCMILQGFIFQNGGLSENDLIGRKGDFYNNKENCNTMDNKLDEDVVGKSVLITGAAGFIGMHASLELKKRGFHVVGIDNMSVLYNPQLKTDRVALLKDANVEFIRGDICDEALLVKIIQNHKIERVIHLAAQPGVRNSIKAPHDYTRNNVDCFVSVLETLVKTGLHNKPLVFASSSSVYGFSSNPPSSESTSDVDHPASLYAATKRSDELIAHTYNHLYNINSVGLRFFTVYGPYGRPDMSPMIFAKKIQNGEKLQLSNFGESVRDFTYVSDVVNGIIAALHYKPTGVELMNIGGNNPIKLTRFVDLMERGLKRKAVTELVPMQNGDVPLTYADVQKAKCLLGWTPEVPIETGMKRFLEWFESHDATRYMSAPQKEICFINASFSKDIKVMDDVMDVSQFKSDRYAFYFFSNLDLDFSDKGWSNIKMDLPFRRMITQSRWPKFLGWKHPEVASNCKTVFYFDVSSRPCKEGQKHSFVHYLDTFDSNTLNEIEKLIPEVMSSESGFAVQRHTRSSKITEEFQAVLKYKKDLKKNIDASLKWMRSQDDFKDDAQVYENTYFLYNPLNQNFRDATEFFWERYSQEIDSWRDQPMMAYVYHHFHMNPVDVGPFLTCKGKMGHKDHTYTKKDD